MNLLVTALFDEAKPFIEATGCKKVSNAGNLTYYQGEEISLLIAGCGKVAAAVAVARMLERLDLENVGHVINVGTCGASDSTIPLGTLHLVHKITDQATGRNYFPDRLCASPFQEGSLITVDAGQTQESARKDSLYDMEASGIYQAATEFVTADRVHFLKIVSDHLEPETLIREKVQGWVLSCVPTVLEFVESLPKTEKAKPSEEAELKWLKNVQEEWNLTETQYHQLKDVTIHFRLSNLDHCNLETLVEMADKFAPVTSNKTARNQAFAKLLDALGT